MWRADWRVRLQTGIVSVFIILAAAFECLPQATVSLKQIQTLSDSEFASWAEPFSKQEVLAVRAGDVIVLIGAGPSGTGMQETAQITTALRYLPWGKQVALVTDGRFSGLSTGACIGHVGPEALDEGPVGRVRDDDVIEIVIDRAALTGSVNLVGTIAGPLEPDECAALLDSRPRHPGLAPHAKLPADSRLWAALQRASGGTWSGCVYDVERIVAALDAGLARRATDDHSNEDRHA